MNPGALTCAVLVAAVAGCTAPRPRDPFAPRAVHERGRWQVAKDGRVLGCAVMLEIEDPDEPIVMVRAENAAGQWLGYVDRQSRVWQRVPFAEREVFRGMYPMDKGLALLYEVDGAVELTPVGGERPAAIQFPPREDR